MVNEVQKSEPGGRGRLVVIELVLLAATLWILIWHPLGQAISLAVSIMLAMVFIGSLSCNAQGWSESRKQNGINWNDGSQTKTTTSIDERDTL